MAHVLALVSADHNDPGSLTRMLDVGGGFMMVLTVGVGGWTMPLLLLLLWLLLLQLLRTLRMLLQWEKLRLHHRLICIFVSKGGCDGGGSWG